MVQHLVWREGWLTGCWGPEEVLLAPTANTVLGLVFFVPAREKTSTFGAPNTPVNQVQRL